MSFQVAAYLLDLVPIAGKQGILDEFALEALLGPIWHLSISPFSPFFPPFLTPSDLWQLHHRPPDAVDGLLHPRTQLFRLISPVQ